MSDKAVLTIFNPWMDLCRGFRPHAECDRGRIVPVAIEHVGGTTGRSYEWDYRHGSVEMYSRRGEHLGEFDPIIGRRLKPRDPVMVEQYPILRRLLDLAKNVAHV
jgi:hypothetical protein